MSIQMIGIDHSLAGVEVREKFSFTKRQAAALMKRWKEQEEAQGIVLLSTCNRMEIYVNSEKMDMDFCGLLCREKGLDETQYRPFFCVREGQEAVRHLFEMTAGLCSLIIGEDQILTQAGDALSFAREEYAADKVLEVLFRQAVTTAKEIKTEVLLPRANLSAAGEAVESLKRQGMTFAGKNCLVIGNGMMGRLTAQILLAEGAKVTVTVRQYHKGIVDIPAGAARIDYGNRYQIVPECDYVFSATSSPNLPLTKEKLSLCRRERQQIFVDLAVPRDIEPAVKELPLVTLYNVDDFGLQDISPEMRQGLAEASRLLRKGIEKFQSWYECRELIPAVQRIANLAAADLCGRMEKPLKQIEPKSKEEVVSALAHSGNRVAARMLFALRDELDGHIFRECMEILEKKFT